MSVSDSASSPSTPQSELAARLSRFEAREMARVSRVHDESQLELSMAIAVPVLAGLAALMFGATEAWSFNYISIGLCVLWMALCVDRIIARGQRTLFFHWSFLPPLAFVALVLLQLVPLPTGLIGVISPGTSQTFSAHLGQAPASMRVSLDPARTREQLAVLTAGVAMFLLAAQLLRTPRLAKIALTSLACMLALLVACQLIAIVVGTAELSFLAPVDGLAGGRGGTFVHYNHYSFFVVVSSLLLSGLFVSQTVSKLSGHSVGLRRMIELSDRPGGRMLMVLLALVILALASVAMSGSRTGMLGAMAGLCVLLVMMSRMPAVPGGGWLLAPALLVGCVVVGFFGLDFAVNRFAAATDDGNFASRWGVWKDTLQIVKGHPVLGIGLGAHTSVFPIVDSSNYSDSIAAHVENQYLQLLEETGVVGLTIFLVFIVALVIACVKRARGTRSSEGILVIGPTAALAAAAVHSMADFASHLPANALLLAMTCGLVIAMSRWARGGQFASDLVWNLRTRTLAIAAGVVPVAALALVVIPTSLAAAASENARWSGIRYTQALQSSNWDGKPATYRDALIAFMNEVNASPGDISAVHRLNLVRWQLLMRQDAQGDPLQLSPQGLADAHRVLAELVEARKLVPTHGPSAQLEAEVRVVIEPYTPATRQAVHQALRLNNNSPWCHLQVIQYELNSTDYDIARLAQRYLDLRGDFTPLASLLLTSKQHEVLVQNLAKQNYEWLDALAKVYDHLGMTDMALLARENATAELELSLRDNQGDAAAHLRLARAFARQENFAVAVKHYRQSLYLGGPNPDIRLELARLFISQRDFQQARTELEECLRNRPGWREARDLLSDVLASNTKAPVN